MFILNIEIIIIIKIWDIWFHPLFPKPLTVGLNPLTCLINANIYTYQNADIFIKNTDICNRLRNL